MTQLVSNIKGNTTQIAVTYQKYSFLVSLQNWHIISRVDRTTFKLIFLGGGECKSIYDIMKGLGPVSMSAGFLFPYHVKVEQKFETISCHYSGASNTKFLQKIFMKRETPLPSLLSSSSSSSSSSLLSLSKISSSLSQFIGSLWCQPCLSSFGMKETNYNHHCHHHNHHNHHHHHHHHNNHHCHSFFPPLWCRLCLRSFGNKNSHFPSSRLVKFQHKIDFKPKRLSSFLKKKKEIMFVFSKTCSVFELLRTNLNLAKVDTIPYGILMWESQPSY